MPNVSVLIVCKAVRRATLMHCTTVVTRTNISLTSSALIATGPALHRSTVLQADFSCFSTRTPRAISQLLPRQRLRVSLLKPSKMTGKVSPPLRDSIMNACASMHACRASTCVSLVFKASRLWQDYSRRTSSHPVSHAATMFAKVVTFNDQFELCSTASELCAQVLKLPMARHTLLMLAALQWKVLW